MFHPDADVSPYKPPPSDNPKDLRVIKHSSTRLLSQEETLPIPVPPSPTQSRIDALIMGTPCTFYFTRHFSYKILNCCLSSFCRTKRRSSAVTYVKYFVPRSQPTITHTHRAWANSCETADDMGHAKCHPTHHLGGRRTRANPEHAVSHTRAFFARDDRPEA
jgi:hypothetical protein